MANDFPVKTVRPTVNAGPGLLVERMSRTGAAAAVDREVLSGLSPCVPGRANWVAALLAIASAPLHAWMLFEHSHGALITFLMATMAAWCLWCAVGAIRPPADTRTRSLRHLWSMAIVMALMHIALLTGFPVSAGTHHHGDELNIKVNTGAGLMVAIIVIELTICFACAVALRMQSQSAPTSSQQV